MIRFLMYLFGKENYEPCKACEITRAQLAIANTANRDLHLLLVDIFKPKVELPSNDASSQAPFKPRLLPSQRRAQLEQMSYLRNKTVATSRNIAVDEKEEAQAEPSIPIVQPKTIEDLERELAIGGE